MNSARIALYDKENIDELQWPVNEEAAYTKNFLLPLIKEGSQLFIKNANVQLLALVIDHHVLPLTVSESPINNSYVCSFYGQYIGYGQEEIKRLKNPFLKWSLYHLIRACGKIFKLAQFDKVIFVNNWLISTNLHPPLSSIQIKALKQFLIDKFPGHAIAFRSINFHDTKRLSEDLKSNGFNFLFSRKVFFFDPKNQETIKSRMYKSDLKLFNEASYKILKNDEIPPEAIPRLLQLYNSLYIEKYSVLNPQLTEKMLELLLKTKFLELRAIEKNGVIEGILGYYSRNETMTSPIFGYDTNKPGNDAYRIISTILALEAKENQKILNQSSGASSFKKLRRATPHLEYSAIYYQHLAKSRQKAWGMLIKIFNSLGIPVLNYLDL